MADEWRVMVSQAYRPHTMDASPWATAMRTLCGRVGKEIRVSQTRRGVFLYAASARAAGQAEQVARDVLAEHHVTATVRCDQWNPISESWTSHQDLMKAERAKSARTGRATWQVRVQTWSPHELKELARRLESEGQSVARRWNYLIVGAGCEDDARALADQIQGHTSAGAHIRVQPGVYEQPRVRVTAPGVPTIWVLPKPLSASCARPRKPTLIGGVVRPRMLVAGSGAPPDPTADRAGTCHAFEGCRFG